MFKINDYIMYGSTGVCQVTDIVKSEDCDVDTTFYILHPVYASNMKIKTPVNNTKVVMRPVLTKGEVLALIATMPSQETCWIQDQKERTTTYKAALKSRNNEDLIKIVKTLYEEKHIATKKITKTDEDLMNSAEKQLYEEFAIALNIPITEVVPFIQEQLSQLEAQESGNSYVLNKETRFAWKVFSITIH